MQVKKQQYQLQTRHLLEQVEVYLQIKHVWWNLVHIHQLISGRIQLFISARNQLLISGRNQLLISGRNQLFISGRNQLLISGRNQLLISGRNQLLISCRNQLLISGINQLLSHAIYIFRPSPSRGELGFLLGVAKATSDSIQLCEASTCFMISYILLYGYFKSLGFLQLLCNNFA